MMVGHRLIDPYFGHWIAGFTDGEGSFGIRSEAGGGCYFRLKVRADDRSVLDRIVAETEVGRVKTEAPRFVTWEVSRKEECISLIALFDQYPLRAKKHRDYRIWRQAVRIWTGHPDNRQGLHELNRYLKDTRTYAGCKREGISTSQGFGHWLAGFIAAEGSFNILRTGSGCWFCRFSLALRDDDAGTLHTIHKETGIGKVTQVPAYGSSQPQQSWVVQTKHDCQRLVDILGASSLRGKKALDYHIWSQAVTAMSRRSNHRLNEFKLALEASRRYPTDTN